MDIAMIGLGRMGANMAERLHRGGHHVIGVDPGEAARTAAAERGFEVSASIAETLAALPVPRVVWLMVPAGVVDQTLASLSPHLSEGDVVIDGGNSYYKDSMRRSEQLQGEDVTYIDCGTSGGVWGLQEGYSLMIGGDKAAVERIGAIFRTLAPGEDRGWAHVGPSGAGHFCKMVHNGIEYGMMQAYAEGFALMQHKTDFNLDLEGIAPYVEDSGEGRWTVAEAIDLDVPAPVITLSLLERLRSREKNSFSDRLLAAMRNEFGGHAIKTT